CVERLDTGRIDQHGNVFDHQVVFQRHIERVAQDAAHMFAGLRRQAGFRQRGQHRPDMMRFQAFQLGMTELGNDVIAVPFVELPGARLDAGALGLQPLLQPSFQALLTGPKVNTVIFGFEPRFECPFGVFPVSTTRPSGSSAADREFRPPLAVFVLVRAARSPRTSPRHVTSPFKYASIDASVTRRNRPAPRTFSTPSRIMRWIVERETGLSPPINSAARSSVTQSSGSAMIIPRSFSALAPTVCNVNCTCRVGTARRTRTPRRCR